MVISDTGLVFESEENIKFRCYSHWLEEFKKLTVMHCSRNTYMIRNRWMIVLVGILALTLLGSLLLFHTLPVTDYDCGTLASRGPTRYSYKILHNSDVIGDDLMHVQTKDLDDIKKVCDLFSSCAGFNSNGWLKTKVSTHISGPADLYIKSETLASQGIGTSHSIHSKGFSSSYGEMLANMKIYIYELSTESRISRYYSHDVERRIADKLSASHLRTRKPDEATFFFIPIHCSYFIQRASTEQEGILWAKQHLSETLEVIRRTYPYWDRTAGSDHIYLCAHSIGAGIGGTLLKNSIALVYSADYDSPYFVPQRDISLPPYPTMRSSMYSDSNRRNLALADRPVLAFFAGDVKSGRIRPTMYSFFATDHSIVIFSQDISWNVRQKYLSQSKFCLIARGKDPWSSQLADAIMASCIPVIISDHYHLPLQGIVNWEDFSIIIPESKISELKIILLQVSIAKYKSLKEHLLAVQQHFIWNDLAKPHDAFYSVMFELWQRRDVVRYRRM